MRDRFTVCSCWRIGEDGILEPNPKKCTSYEREVKVNRLQYRDCGFIDGHISRDDALEELRRQNAREAERVEEAEARRKELFQGSRGDDARFVDEMHNGARRRRRRVR